MRPSLFEGLRLPVCVAALGAAAWLATAPASYAQQPHDASAPADAALDARVDTGVRCVPIEDDEEEDEAPHPAAMRDAGAVARDAICA